MNSFTTFICPPKFTLSKSVPKPIDYLTSSYEYPAKAVLRKRSIFQKYLKERHDLTEKMKPTIDFKKWDGDSPEVYEYRSQWNKKWDEIKNLLTEINKKYIPLFTNDKIRCSFCGQRQFPENVIQNFFNNKETHFCNDECMIEFSKLELTAQEKLLNKYGKRKEKKNEETNTEIT